MWPRHELPSQSKSQRQVGQGLVSVLRIEPNQPRAPATAYVRTRYRLGESVCLTSQQVLQTCISDRALIRACAVVHIVVPLLKLHSELKGMLAAKNVHIVI